MIEDLTYMRMGRNRSTALCVLGIWAALALAWFALDASEVILALIGAFTLPAIADLLRNPQAGMTLGESDWRWYSGRRNVRLRLAELALVRLDTRLDFSVRVTAILESGRKIRVPFEATPPSEALEEALQSRGIKTERHHFALFQ